MCACVRPVRMYAYERRSFQLLPLSLLPFALVRPIRQATAMCARRVRTPVPCARLVRTRVRVCAHVRACVCLFGARPSGHPLTVNNEHGTYDRCVGDGGYTGCLAQLAGLPRERAKWKRRSAVVKREKQPRLSSQLLSFLFLSFPPFQAVWSLGMTSVKSDFGKYTLRSTFNLISSGESGRSSEDFHLTRR